MSDAFKDSVVVFLDILGFKNLIKNETYANELLSVIKNIKRQNTRDFSVSYDSDGKGNHTITAMPIITSFSDCIVLSVPIHDSFNIGDCVNTLLGLIQQIADSLICGAGGYILRGGMVMGKLYHEDGVVFGESLIEAHRLESKEAKNPRILVCNKLGEEYNKYRYDGDHFISQENIHNKEEYYLDYLKLSFQSSETRDRYLQKSEEIVKKCNDCIYMKEKNNDLENLDKIDEILKKWLYFKNYVEKTAQKYYFDDITPSEISNL